MRHILMVSVSDSTRNLLIIGIIDYVENKKAWNGVIFNNTIVLYKLYIKLNYLICRFNVIPANKLGLVILEV